MKNIYTIVIAGALLSGCMNTTAGMGMLEGQGGLSVQPSFRSDFDYAVSVKNYIDFGFNPDRKQDRDRIALQFVSAQCPKGRIVGEDKITTGTYLGTRPRNTYVLRVKC